MVGAVGHNELWKLTFNPLLQLFLIVIELFKAEGVGFDYQNII